MKVIHHEGLFELKLTHKLSHLQESGDGNGGHCFRQTNQCSGDTYHMLSLTHKI